MTSWEVLACWRRYHSDTRAGHVTPDNVDCRLRHGRASGCEWWQECEEYMEGDGEAQNIED